MRELRAVGEDKHTCPLLGFSVPPVADSRPSAGLLLGGGDKLSNIPGGNPASWPSEKCRFSLLKISASFPRVLFSREVKEISASQQITSCHTTKPPGKRLVFHSRPAQFYPRPVFRGLIPAVQCDGASARCQHLHCNHPPGLPPPVIFFFYSAVSRLA